MVKIESVSEGIIEVNSLVRHCPKLEHFACKKLEKIIKELEWKVKLCKEWEELKIKEEELKCKIELEKEKVEVKIHEEIEEIKHKKHECELHLHEDLEELKLKADVALHKINPIDKLKFGFLKFKVHFEEEKDHYEKLAHTHKPKCLIFSSCDSRVDPCKLFHLELGEAIIVRNVAGIVVAHGNEGPYPCVGASIEYAIKEHQVEHIFVIGHSKCESVHSMVKEHGHFSESLKNILKIGRHHHNHDFVKSWMKTMEHSCKKVKESHSSLSVAEQCPLVEKECVTQSMHNLLTYPFVKEAYSQKKVSIHGGYYDMGKCSFDHWSYDEKHIEVEKSTY